MNLSTYNFKMQDVIPNTVGIDSRVTPDGQVFSDRKNGISTKKIWMDAPLIQYYNYIQLLNANRDSWVSNGYLDLGMMPIVACPEWLYTFLRDKLVSDVIVNKYGVKYYSMKPTSMLLERPGTSSEDIWIFKEDLVNALNKMGKNVTPQQVNLCSFLKMEGLVPWDYQF